MIYFSVIIPVFNRGDLISATINSVLKQNFDSYEIIVVDDGSTDNTLDILAQYGNRIKVLQQSNKGPGEARNLGIKYAMGEYVAFIDSDDIWLPWTLEVYATVIKQTDAPSFITGNATFFHEENELSKIICSQLHYSIYQDFYTSSKTVTLFLTSSVVVRLDMLQAAGGFTDRWINSEDNDLWLKLGTAKGFVHIQSPTVLGYRQHSNSAIASNIKTYEGTCHLIEQEKQGKYPGGKDRQGERLEILTRHIRPVSLACLRQVELQQAWFLYKETILWNIQLLRMRYLIVFPLLFLFTMLRGKLVIRG